MDGGNRIGRRELLGAAVGGVLASAGCIQYCQPQGGPSSGPGGPVSTGGAGERFYTNGPPTRNGETITATDHDSLQTAHDVLQPGDQLFIPASGGPYRERLEVTRDNVTIASDGALLTQPDGSEYWALSVGSAADYPPATSLTSPHGPGDATIRVADTSPFAVGDDIHITEWRRPWGEPRSGGAHGADTTSEFRTVTGIDPDAGVLSLHHPLNLPYPGESVTDVGVMSWSATDVRVTGLRLDGLDDDSSRPLRVSGTRDVWVDNVTIEYGAKNAAVVRHSMRPRLDGITINGGGQYGVNVNHGTTHAFISNVTSKDHNRYTVRFGLGGGTSRSSSDGLAQNIEGNVDGRTVANCHWGGFAHTYQDVTAIDSQVVSFRSRGLVLDGFEKTGGGDPDIVFAQRPANCVIKDGRITQKEGGRVFNFRLRETGGAHGNERFDNIHIENIYIEPYGRDLTEIGNFETDGNGSGGDGLRFTNIRLGDQRLTREHVAQWDGYNEVDIRNLVVE